MVESHLPFSLARAGPEYTPPVVGRGGSVVAPRLEVDYVKRLANMLGEAHHGEVETDFWRSASTCHGKGVRRVFQPTFGRGYSETVALEPGVHLIVHSSCPAQPFALWSRHEGTVFFSVVLDGCFETFVPGAAVLRVEGPSYLRVAHPPHLVGCTQFKAHQQLLLVSLFFSDIEALARYAGLPAQVLTARLDASSRAAGVADERQSSILLGAPGAGAMEAARAIVGCPFDNHLRYIFLSAKAKEFFCFLLAREISCAQGGVETQLPIASRISATARAKSIVASKLGRKIRVAELAASVGVSPNKLMRDFRNAYGMTVQEFSRMTRLEEARRLLCETELAITEIALIVGYDKAGSLTEAFKAHFGVLPKHYRNGMSAQGWA